MVLVPCSVGDALDRMTILAIKSERITDADKLRHVREELEAVAVAVGYFAEDTRLAGLRAALKDTNERLWDVEDGLRVKERDIDFGEDFIALARSVYVLNDARAGLKRQINAAAGSDLVEVKSYAPVRVVRPPQI
jgi:hypothetical protein